MNSALSGIVSLASIAMSFFSTGVSTYTQVNQARAMARPTPPAIVQRYCPPPSVGQAQLMSDGSYQIICVEPQYAAGQP
jgi:hypothetical protein